MANQLFRERLISRINNAIKEAKEVKAIDHRGLEGRLREIIVEQLLKPFLPGGFEIGTGKIVDSHNNLSPETDIIIYNRRILPPILYSERDGVFPIEACFYAIEVKSTITSKEIDDAINKAQRISRLKYIYGKYDASNDPIPHDIIPVIPCLFAFNTDLSPDGKSEFQRLSERIPSFSTNPLLRGVCVVNQGYYHIEKPKKWVIHPSTEDHDEVIDFVGSIANTLPGVLETRFKPRFGNYLMITGPVTFARY